MPRWKVPYAIDRAGNASVSTVAWLLGMSRTAVHANIVSGLFQRTAPGKLNAREVIRAVIERIKANSSPSYSASRARFTAEKASMAALQRQEMSAGVIEAAALQRALPAMAQTFSDGIFAVAPELAHQSAEMADPADIQSNIEAALDAAIGDLHRQLSKNL